MRGKKPPGKHMQSRTFRDKRNAPLRNPSRRNSTGILSLKKDVNAMPPAESARPCSKQYSSDDMIKALHATNGMVYLAAEKLGCSSQLIYYRASLEEEVHNAILEERGKHIDFAETQLKKASKKGQAWAVLFTLKTIGKTRGYGEKVEHTFPGGLQPLNEHIDPTQILASMFMFFSDADKRLLLSGGAVQDAEVVE